MWSRTLLMLMIPCSALAAAITGRVSAVPSGDVLIVTTEQGTLRVRIADIDAPESDQPFGPAAREFLARQVLNRDVEVETQGEDADGTTLGDVKLGERDLASELVSGGYAWALAAKGASGNLRHLQAQARAGHRGLWGHGTPFAPWEWRAARERLKRLAAAQALPVTADRKRHVFYPPGCAAPGDLPGTQRTLFKTVPDAEAAGYRRAPSCRAP